MMSLDRPFIMETLPRMTIARSRESGPEFFRRLIAAGCAALVLSLAVFAACPDLHHWLHGEKDSGGDDDDGCAVVLFAHGVTEAAVATVLVVVALRLLGKRLPMPAELLLQEPRFQLPPGCGPPLG